MAFRWTGRGAARHARGMIAGTVLILAAIAGVPAQGSAADIAGPRRAIVRGEAGGGKRPPWLAGMDRAASPGSGPGPGAGSAASPDANADAGGTQLDFFPFSFGNHPRPLPRARAYAPIPAVAASLKLPRVQGDPARPLVVIDAGHGGFDPGAVSAETGLREKDVTLRIARAIRDELLRSGRVRVALTRDDDRYLVLRERFGIARRLRADLFISIHCDSVGGGPGGGGGASGASVYTLSEVASDKEAARLALRENKADTISGVDLGDAPADVSSILIDLTQRETMNSSADFARLLGREGRDLVPMKPVFHRMASLMVLKAPDMPSILFETGYLSNPRDAAFLDSTEGEDRIAQSIRRAVEVHFARRVAMR